MNDMDDYLKFWIIVIITLTLAGTVLGCCAMHEGYSYHETSEKR